MVPHRGPCRLDQDGRLIITGRKKDIIIRGGENISANEVEDVVERHQAVLAAVAIGVPDPRYGERVCCVVAYGRAPTSAWTTSERISRARDGPYKRRPNSFSSGRVSFPLPPPEKSRRTTSESMSWPAVPHRAVSPQRSVLLNGMREERI